MIGEHPREMISRADEEVVTNDVSYHFLVEKAVVHFLPVRVLQTTLLYPFHT